jgi:putative PEP-CTERM system TPR-repeat lipoprotein
MKTLFLSLALLLATAVASLPAGAADPGKAEKFIEDARKSLAKNDTKSALIQLKNAVQADPDNAAARFELGLLQLRTGDALSAQKELRAARDRNYPEDQIAAPLAESYLRLQQYDVLLAEIPPGYRPGSVESDVRLSRGLSLLALQRYPEAEEALTAALERADRPGRVLIALARLKGAQGDFAKANEYIAQAIDADGKMAEAWVLRGQLKRIAGDRDGARADYDRALELLPASETAHLARAQVLVDQGQFPLAESDINVVLAAQPNNTVAVYLRGLIQARQQRYAEARTTLQKLGSGVNFYPPALYLLAGINLAQNELAQAEDNINRYLAQLPGDQSGSMLLANVLLRRGNIARAIEVLKTASDTDPPNPRLLALLSTAYQRNNQPDESAKVLDRIALLAPDNAQLRTQIATQRLRMGRAGEAVHDLEAATAAAPSSPQARILLILTFLQETKLEDAVKAATDFRDSEPTSAVAENLLGVVELRKSGPAAGKQHFEKAVELKPDFIPARMNLAQIALFEKRPDEARRIYDEVLKLDPANENALVGAAEISAAEGRQDEAIGLLEQARAANPQSTVTRIRLIDAYLGRQEAGMAVQIAAELATVGANDASSMRAVGRAYSSAEDMPNAIAAYKAAVKLEPTSANHYELARAYSLAKDTASARASLEKALELKPGDLALQQSYVEFMRASDALETAITFARRLNDAAVKDGATNVLLGDLLHAAGRRSEAANAYRQGLEKNDNPLLVVRLAAVLDPPSAAKTYLAWLVKHPDDDKIRFLLASLYLSNKQYERSLVEHEKILERQPKDAVVLNNLAWLYDQKGDTRAVALAERAHEAAPQAPTITDTLGWILLRKGDQEKALPLLADAAQRAPNQPEIQYHYGVALKQAGKTQDAKAILEKVVAANEKAPEAAEAIKVLDEIAKQK